MSCRNNTNEFSSASHHYENSFARRWRNFVNCDQALWFPEILETQLLLATPSVMISFICYSYHCSRVTDTRFSSRLQLLSHQLLPVTPRRILHILNFFIFGISSARQNVRFIFYLLNVYHYVLDNSDNIFKIYRYVILMNSFIIECQRSLIRIISSLYLYEHLSICMIHYNKKDPRGPWNLH